MRSLNSKLHGTTLAHTTGIPHTIYCARYIGDVRTRLRCPHSVCWDLDETPTTYVVLSHVYVFLWVPDLGSPTFRVFAKFRINILGLARRQDRLAFDMRNLKWKSSCTLFTPNTLTISAALPTLQQAALFGTQAGGAVGSGGDANVPLPGVPSPGLAGIYHPQASTVTRQPFSPGPNGVFDSAAVDNNKRAAQTGPIDPVFCFDDSGKSGSTHDADWFRQVRFQPRRYQPAWLRSVGVKIRHGWLQLRKWRPSFDPTGTRPRQLYGRLRKCTRLRR